MSNQIYHKRAISGVQQSNTIKLKEGNLITTMSSKKTDSNKTQSSLISNNLKNQSNSKIKSQNKSSQKSNNLMRSISPISSSKEDFINNYINKKLNLNQEAKNKSKEKLQNSNNNLISNTKPILNSFNQKNSFKTNQTTISSTNNTTLSQRSNQIAKSQRDNSNINLNTKTLDSESNTVHNLTTEGNKGNRDKRLTLFSAGDAMANIEKIAKQHLASQNNRNKTSKSPVNTSGINKTSDGNRSISPSLKQQIEKIEMIKKNISNLNNIKAMNDKLLTLKSKTNSNDNTKRNHSPLSKSTNTRSKSPSNNNKTGTTGTPSTNSTNYNINILTNSQNLASKENKLKESVTKGNVMNPREMNYSPLLRKKSKEVSNENLKKITNGVVKNSQTQSSQIIDTKDLSRSKSSDKKVSVSKGIKLIYEVTRTGFTGQEQKKVNQDNYFVHKNFNNNTDSVFVGVCDGHGSVGHDVSSFLRENLPKTLESEVKKAAKHNTPLNKTIKDVFLSVNCKLFNEATIDTHFSLIYTKEKITCANVGDSRAVMGRLVNGVWKHQNLSRDHKPNDPDEKQRINNRNGRVEPFKDENGEYIGPARVWLMEHNIPGLAMSRSFGDKTAAQVGVISEPEIIEWNITKDDMFIVLASDGVWEFIESDEEFYLSGDIVGAGEYLVDEATRRWRREEDVVDDITVVIIFLEN